MDTQNRFHDNPNGLISDTQNNKEWLPKDSWQDLGKWNNWREAMDYVRLMNQVYPGGHSDWRLPTREETVGLYDAELASTDWEGKEIHIHPVFVRSCSFNIWTSEVNDKDQVLAVNLRDGSASFLDKSTQKNQAARLVRDVVKAKELESDIDDLEEDD